MATPATLRDAIAFPARTAIFPGTLRAGYALLLKRLFGLFRRPAIVNVADIGTMRLEPWDLIDSRIYFFDVWEPALTRFMQRQVRPGAVVADIGANIGYYTLLLSRAVGPEGHVYAIEPSPEIRTRLDDALALNGISNVTVVPYGISDRIERRAFTISKANLGASKFGEPAEDGLELRRLSDVIPADQLARLSFIKIDVEGMEDAVMRDILTLLPQLPRELTLCAELRMNPEMRGIVDRFKQAGMSLLHLPNRYSMFDYPAHPTEPEPCDDPGDGQIDLALVRT
jgi:FkbM family methyltransferase